jgi:TetR/AcrR family tetracycline transcriptional repressor
MIGEAHSKPMTGRRDSFAAKITPRLSRDAVTAATLALIDQRGLPAATMRAIAHRLGVKAQSLYTHIANREDLLDAVADRIVSEVDSDPAMHHVVTDSWQHSLIDTAHAVRRCARRHPSAFVLVATRPAHPVKPEPRLLSHRWVTNVLAIFERSGFTDDEIAFAYRAFDAFLLGSLLLETRDLVTKAPTASATRLRSDPTRALAPADHGTEDSRPADQHDDDFAADLDDVIGRIANKVEHATRAPDVSHRS